MRRRYARCWRSASSFPPPDGRGAEETDSTDVQQLVRKTPHRHDLRRKPRPGDRLRRRWLSAGPRARGGGFPRAISTAARPARAATPRSATRPTRSRSCPASTKAARTGTPIALLIRNTDARSKDYNELADTFRPGHADYTYWQKYGIRDPRGGGRSSARETTMRVAAAVIAKKWLAEKVRRARARLSRADRRASCRAHSTGPRSKPIRSSGRMRRWSRNSKAT